jgi:hypothetical protein
MKEINLLNAENLTVKLAIVAVHIKKALIGYIK